MAGPPHRSRRRRTPLAALLGILALVWPLAAPRAQPDPAKAAPMTAAQIQTVLRARGYADLDRITREDEVFRIDGVSRYGEPVGAIEVDAVSGTVRDERLSAGQARRMLRQRGFEEVSEVRPDGAALIAQARRAGNPVEVRIDPQSGAVTQTRVNP